MNKEKQIKLKAGLHHPAFPASKKINCEPKLCKECHPHEKKILDKTIEELNKLDDEFIRLSANSSVGGHIRKVKMPLNLKPTKDELLQENFDLKEQLEKAEDAWQASIDENVRLKRELSEIKHLCSIDCNRSGKEILADVAYILKRRKEEDKLTKENSHV